MSSPIELQDHKIIILNVNNQVDWLLSSRKISADNVLTFKMLGLIYPRYSNNTDHIVKIFDSFIDEIDRCLSNRGIKDAQTLIFTPEIEGYYKEINEESIMSLCACNVYAWELRFLQLSDDNTCPSDIKSMASAMKKEANEYHRKHVSSGFFPIEIDNSFDRFVKVK